MPPPSAPPHRHQYILSPTNGQSSIPLPSKVIRKGEVGEEIGGVKFFHPHLERVIVDIAKSPYQMKSIYYYSQKKKTSTLNTNTQLLQYRDLPSTITKKFVTAATFDVYKTRKYIRTSLPYDRTQKDQIRPKTTEIRKKKVYISPHPRLIVAQSKLIRILDSYSNIFTDTDDVLKNKGISNRLAPSPIDKNASSALMKIHKVSNELHKNNNGRFRSRIQESIVRAHQISVSNTPGLQESESRPQSALGLKRRVTVISRRKRPTTA
jgi:hypothetical protein